MPTPDLAADCSRCSGLCCVLLPYRRDGGFGADKPGGVACQHLTDLDRCGIHADLAERGWPGCVVFDCFGAGQQVTQVTYGGRSWREQQHEEGGLAEMAAVLSVLRVVHEMLQHLGQVARRSPDPRAADLERRLLELRDATPTAVLTADLDELHAQCGSLLAAASLRVRGGDAPDLSGSDLAGQDLRGRDLRTASLRGALLIGADLRGTDLGTADLLGADLRDADLRGADLGQALFLTRPQLRSAHTDAGTRLPSDLLDSPTGETRRS